MSGYDSKDLPKRLPPELQKRIDKMHADGLITKRPAGMPELKFPPAPFSEEWWSELTPEQQQQVRDRMTLAVGRIGQAMQDVMPLLKAIGDAAVPALGLAITAFVRAASGLAAPQFEEHDTNREPRCPG